MREVEAKVKKISSLDKDGVKECVDEHPIPTVVGPGDHTYMIDHHHFVAACWQCGVKEVKVQLLATRNDLTHDEFWDFMRSRKWLYLYDQFGGGPHDPKDLPLDVRGMSDDPYRSLAWELREAGIIAKVQEPFSEFKWAAFLRANLKVDLHAESWKDAVKRACALTQAEIAKEAKPTPAPSASAAPSAASSKKAQ
jgi:hypothetical protein